MWGVVFLVTIMILGLGCAKKSAQVRGEPGQVGAAGPTPEELRAREEAERRRRIAESQLGARSGAVTPGMSVMQPVYFDFNLAGLSEDAKGTLARNADWLRTNPQVRIQVEGHADERGTSEYNLALGERRAESVKSYLTSLGIDGGRLVTISYGEERSADPGHDEEAWALNRRAEFKAM
ncbi:MAG: peptidoglycan-associated lipoprotein Pal [Nitrospinae bacterium]|nr:peptidoglycan-associated lipoprotein Pal [Nitrospinota bacterium]